MQQIRFFVSSKASVQIQLKEPLFGHNKNRPCVCPCPCPCPCRVHVRMIHPNISVFFTHVIFSGDANTGWLGPVTLRVPLFQMVHYPFPNKNRNKQVSFWKSPVQSYALTITNLFLPTG